jgi:lipopolysaccharide transport system ATP-binding protein
VLLKSGRIAKLGSTEEVIESYLDYLKGGKVTAYTANPNTLAGDIAIEWAGTTNEMNETTPYFVHSEPIIVRVSCLINRWIPNAEMRLVVDDSWGRRVFTSDVALRAPSGGSTTNIAEAKIPGHFLRPATYLATICTFVNNQVIIQSVPNAFTFMVQDGGTKYAASQGIDYGCVFSPCEWTVVTLDHLQRTARAPNDI